MQLQIYGVWVSLAVSLVGLGFITQKVEPQSATPSIKTLFFIAIFILVWSTATAISFSIKNRLVKSRALSHTASEPIFYDSLLFGLLAAVIAAAAILIRKYFL